MGKENKYNEMTEEEWQALCKKAERKVRKTVRNILIAVIVILLITGVFWAVTVYVRDYKVRDVAQSVSPDGKYELVLQAVGEADWPFGPADGRLILREGERKVSEADFIVYDDGKMIWEDTWEVTWFEDHVEVILSGEEKTDELVRLYYDGEKEWEQPAESRQETEMRGNGQEDFGIISEQVSAGTDNVVAGQADEQTEEPELPQPYAKYAEVLEQILAEHVDPNGRVFDTADDRYDFGYNTFAILDVDRDGRQELIFNFNTSNMAGMCEVVYGYDEESGTLREEFAEWVNTVYYGNGVIQVPDSHNHGKDPEERGIWPYALYQYEEETDSYRLQYCVESWDRQTCPENFPAQLDRDGDGILYYIMEGTETVENTAAVPMDREAYDIWAAEQMPEWNKISVTYHPMTEEGIGSIREAYAQAAAYAVHADKWMPQSAEEPFGTNYLLYDMDRDGSLELLANTVRGSGRFSENHFYGLSNNGELLELPLVRLCGGRKKEWASVFDIYAWAYDAAYQDREGIVYYEGNDFTREGIYGGYDETGFYYLKEGTVYQDSIRTCSRFTDAATGKEENHYYRIEDTEKEITEEEYEAVRKDYIKDMEEIRICQRWTEFTDAELAGGEISAEAVSLRLLSSYLESK